MSALGHDLYKLCISRVPNAIYLHTKFQSNRPSGSGEDSFKVFTIYGHDGHPSHVPRPNIRTFFPPLSGDCI